jgi:hypothetical protein
MTELCAVDDVLHEYSGRSLIVLEYSRIVARVLASAREPGFSVASWAPLAALIDTDRFERIGNFKDVMTWTEYAEFLTRWAPDAQWDCSFKRISEAGDLVVLELEERAVTNGVTTAVNSLSVYEFDDDDRIHHVDVYLQMPIPVDFLPEAYAGVRVLD